MRSPLVAMSRGPGAVQRFILSDLSKLPEDEWMLVADLIERYAESVDKPITESLDRTIRNAYRRLANPMEPKVQLKWVDKKFRIRLTWLGRAEQTNPWSIKEQQMSRVWQEVQVEQLRKRR